MKIEVWLDYACPFCYIGKRNLEQAIENIDFKDNIVIRHKSYELNPESDYTTEKTYYEVLAEKYDLPFKKVEQINENITTQAARVGLIYNFDTMKPTTTFDAHRVTQLATKEGKGEEMAERLFKAFFTEGQLISDEDVLRDLSDEVGLNCDKVDKVLGSRKFSSMVRDDEDEAEQMDVQGVPFFVFNETYAVSGVQSVEAFTEVINAVWKEENEDPVLKSLTTENSETSCCSGETCRIDKEWS